MNRVLKLLVAVGLTVSILLGGVSTQQPASDKADPESRKPVSQTDHVDSHSTYDSNLLGGGFQPLTQE